MRVADQHMILNAAPFLHNVSCVESLHFCRYEHTDVMHLQGSSNIHQDRHLNLTSFCCRFLRVYACQKL